MYKKRYNYRVKERLKLSGCVSHSPKIQKGKHNIRLSKYTAGLGTRVHSAVSLPILPIYIACLSFACHVVRSQNKNDERERETDKDRE